MADKSDGPLLDLNTLVERKHILIDGQPYEFMVPGAMSLLDYHRVTRLSDTLKGIEDKKDDLSEEDVQRGAKALDGLCRLVLEAPSAVHDRLTDLQRTKILEVFRNLPRPAAPAQEERAPAAAPDGKTSTGANKSRGSRGSTGPRP